MNRKKGSGEHTVCSGVEHCQVVVPGDPLIFFTKQWLRDILEVLNPIWTQ